MFFSLSRINKILTQQETWRSNYVVPTLKRRQNTKTTSQQRCSEVVCWLGRCLAIFLFKNLAKLSRRVLSNFQSKLNFSLLVLRKHGRYWQLHVFINMEFISHSKFVNRKNFRRSFFSIYINGPIKKRSALCYRKTKRNVLRLRLTTFNRTKSEFDTTMLQRQVLPFYVCLRIAFYFRHQFYQI